MNIPNSIRLSYKLIDSTETQFLFDLDQDPLVMKYINGGQPNDMEQIINVLIPRMEVYRNPIKGWGLWKVTELANNRDIGWMLIRPMNMFSDNPEFDNLEIGWRFYRDVWGCGYATEAAQQLVSRFKNVDGVKKISAIAQEENVASVNIMKKLGMRYIKSYRHVDPLLDLDVVYYELAL